MAALLLLVERVLSVLLSVFGLVAAIQQAVQHAAQEHAPYQVEGIVTTSGLTLANPTYGLQAFYNKYSLFDSDVRIALSLIQADLGTILARLTPPPPTATAIANAVWSFDNAGTAYRGLPAWWTLEEVVTRLVQQDHGNVYRLRNAPLFAVYAPERYVGISQEYYGRVPEPDFTDIQPDDTVLTWLVRTETHFTWEYQDWTGLVSTTDTLPGESVFFCLLRADEFARLKPGAGYAAPVWPGLDLVTLGTPVALSEDATIPGPLHGLLVSVTTPPSGLGNWTMGGRKWWFRAGQIAFVSDHGEVEPWQYLTWDQALYTPSRMSQADHAILRALAGIGGVATPWVYS